MNIKNTFNNLPRVVKVPTLALLMPVYLLALNEKQKRDIANWAFSPRGSSKYGPVKKAHNKI